MGKGTIEDTDVVILVVDDEPGIAAEEGGKGGVDLDEVEVEEIEVEEKVLEGVELGVENGELEITENGKNGEIEGRELGISGVDIGKERLGKGADVLFDDTSWDEPLRLSTGLALSSRVNVNMTQIVDRKQLCIFGLYEHDSEQEGLSPRVLNIYIFLK